MKLSRSVTGVLGAAIAFSPILMAQVPDGWYVVSSFSSYDCATYPTCTSEDGRLFFVNPRSPSTVTPPIQVTGLGCDLTGGVCAPLVTQGANSVLRRPSDGALIVGEVAPSGATLDLHILTLSGATVVDDDLYPVGVGGGTLNQIAQCALLPTGDILVGVSGIVAGPLAGAILGVASPTSGSVTPVPVAPIPGPAGSILNAATVDAAGTTAYFGMFDDPAPGSSSVYSVPMVGGAPTLLATVSGGVSNLAIDDAGQLVASFLGIGPPGNLRRIDPSNGAVTTIGPPTGALSGVAMERATGNYALVAGYAPAFASGATYWATPGGAATQLTFYYLGWWGAKSGIDVNPDPEAYGTDTPGSNQYEWQLAPNPGGLPTMGNASFSLTVTATPGPMPGASLYAMSLGPASIPILGITLLIDPAQLITVGIVPASGVIGLPIPNDPALVGGPTVTDGQIFFQTFHFGAGGPSGISASNGVAVTVL